MNEITASAPGKIILTGEHFVVHGSHSVAAAINKRARVTISPVYKDSYIISGNVKTKMSDNDGKLVLVKAILKNVGKQGNLVDPIAVSVDSEIPPGSGLGSSAAVAVATSAAALKFAGLDPSPRKIFELAMTGEKMVHGNPSGIDVESSLQGGLLLFSRSTGAKSVPLTRTLHFLVVYSGKQRRTSVLVNKVALKQKLFPNFFDSLARSASILSQEVANAATAGDLPRLGAFMNISQAALSWIGVSNDSLDELIEELAGQNVLGAKLTCAGGGGSVIALPKPKAMDMLSKYATKKFSWSFFTAIPQPGLRWEN